MSNPVLGGQMSLFKSAKFDMPKNTRMVIKMVPGVIEVCGNGKEAVPLEK